MSDRTKRIAVGSLMYAVAEAVAAGADWPTVLDAVTTAYDTACAKVRSKSPPKRRSTDR